MTSFLKINKHRIIIIIYLFFLIFSPAKFFGIRVDMINILIVSLLPFVYVYYLNVKIPLKSSLIFLFCYFVLQIFIVVWYDLFSGLFIGNLLQLSKPILFIAACIMGYLTSINVSVRTITKYLIVIQILMLIITLLQYFQIKEIFNIYSSRDNAIIAEQFIGNRVIGAIGNPNFFGLFELGFFMFFLVSYLQTKNKTFLLLSLSCIICLLFSQSRTSILAFIVLIFSFFVNNLKNKKIILLGITTILLVLVGSYWIMTRPEFRYLFTGFSAVLDNGLENQSSFKGRLNIWNNLITQIKAKPFFGHGPNLLKNENGFADNNFIFILYRFGIVGLLLFLLSIKAFFKFSYFKLTSPPLQILTFSLWFILLFGSLSMEALESIKLTPFSFYISFYTYGKLS